MRNAVASFLVIGFAAGTFAVAACSSDSDSTPLSPDGGTSGTPVGDGGDPLANAQGVVDNYAANLYAAYSDSLSSAKTMQTALKTFTDGPTDATLKAAKDAYLAARKPYMQTEIGRFYQGPIDNDTDGPEGDINAWPLDENFIDYTRDDKDAGLINDTTFEITKENIQKKNTEGGEANVSDGYHAIEFLLWGQDDIDVTLKTPGHRPVTDYTTLKNADRRKAFLLAVTELLIDDLQTVTDAWAPNATNYRATFVADKKTAISNILKGIGSLANAELSGERMIAPYKSKAQEDEHSCFSDTTNIDLQGDFVGIQNVYNGTYGSSSGAGLGTLVAAVKPDLDTKFKADMEAAAAAFTEMQKEPFDFAIQQADSDPSRQAILKAIQSVQALAGDTSEIAAALGVSITLDESESKL